MCKIYRKKGTRMIEKTNDYAIKLKKEFSYSSKGYWINRIGQLPEFKENPCILYEKAYISDIIINEKSENKIKIDKELSDYMQHGATIDYMICLGDKVVAGINFSSSDEVSKLLQLTKTYLKVLPVFQFSDTLKHQPENIENIDIVFDCLQIQIRNLLALPSKFLFPTTSVINAMQQIKKKNIEFNDLEDTYLLKQNVDKIDYPTEYGQECGFLIGYYTNEKTGELYYTLRCLPKAIEELRKISRWKNGEIDLFNDFGNN